MKWDNRYKKLIENGSEGILIIDDNSSIIDVNGRAVKMLGYRSKEFKHLSMHDITQKGENTGHACFDNIRDGKQCLYEETLVCKNGNLLDVEISGKRFNDGAFIAFIRDIADRKKIRESMQYQSFLLRNLMEAVISTDVSFKILSWNYAAEKLYGWTEEEVLGKKISEVLDTSLIEESPEHVFGALNKNLRWTGEVVHKAKSGLSYHILTSLELLKNEHNEPSGYIFINVDISEKVFIKNKLDESIREFKKIAWMQSHEVRAPLTNILGLIDLVDFENNTKDFNQQLLQYLKVSANQIDAAIKKVVRNSVIVNERICRPGTDRCDLIS